MSFRSFMFHSVIRLEQYMAATPLLRSSFRNRGSVKTVFFPGCSLAAYSPDYVLKIRDFISKKSGKFEDCEVFTACCAKPLKLMGMDSVFKDRIDAVRRGLDAINAETVVTACQNCFKILRKYDTGRNIVSLWPLVSESGLPDGCEGRYSGMHASIQDSCAMCDFPEVAEAVRKILKHLGVAVHEMEVSGCRAKCCGGIAMLKTGSVKLGRECMMRRADESPCEIIISYCASCRSAMAVNNAHKSLHLADLIWGRGEPCTGSLSFINNILNRYRTARIINKII